MRIKKLQEAKTNSISNYENVPNLISWNSNLFLISVATWNKEFVTMGKCEYVTMWIG